MVKVCILCVGKLKERYLCDAVTEYCKRLTPYAKVEICEVGEYRLPAEPSGAEIAAGIEKEGAELAAKIPPRAAVIALCVEGNQLSSEDFSAKLDRLALTGASEICFLIGGSFGLSEALKRRADLRLSFSKMTFPHQLMRVILLEQVYRAFQISTGGKYHK